MDLTQFMHGGLAEIVACLHCGTMQRSGEGPVHYESDTYDADLMRYLYPRYREAFARKRDRFLPLLPASAEVLEVGSHLGAFLENAETWGWRPTGLDIGRDTSSFARRQGCAVKRVSLEDYSPRRRLDAVFIWNCFEQLGDPWATVVHARSLLARHGVAVLRVPNPDFYRRARPSAGGGRLRALGYNNLLGFPYLYGYGLKALQHLLASAGFQPIASFPASLLTPPYPEMNRHWDRQWNRTRAETERSGAENSPWIEIAGRAMSSSTGA